MFEPPDDRLVLIEALLFASESPQTRKKMIRMTNHAYHPQQLEELCRQQRKLYNINDNIARHLIGSIIQLLRYGEKYNVKIPQKEQLEHILHNTKFLLEEHKEMVKEFNDTLDYFNADQPKSNTKKTDEDVTEPFVNCGWFLLGR